MPLDIGVATPACSGVSPSGTRCSTALVAEAAPQTGSGIHRRVAVADRLGIVEPVGGRTVAVFPPMAPLAIPAGEVMLEKDEITFLEPFASRELAAHARQVAHVFVTHDQRAAAQRQAILADVGAANA